MKCAIVVDSALPVGLVANTAAVLAMSIGHKMPHIIGADAPDGNGSLHRGITHAVVPILKGDAALVRTLRERLERLDGEQLFYVDFCGVAQQSTDYKEYMERLRQTPADELRYLGIAICGPVRQVNSLTGSLALLR